VPLGGRGKGAARWGVFGVSGAVNGVPNGVPKGDRVCADWTKGSWSARYMLKGKVMLIHDGNSKQSDTTFFNESFEDRFCTYDSSPMQLYMSEWEGFESFSAPPCTSMASEPVLVLLKDESASMSKRLSLFWL
jgi:hypothetical protein